MNDSLSTSGDPRWSRSGIRRASVGLLERHFNLVSAVALAALLAFAWHNRFVQDDAFIAFRYAQNWVEGHGLVFNPGERVEGYTCFLYVVLIGVGLKLGVEPVLCSYAIGLVACAGTLLVTQRLVAMLTGSRSVGLLAMVMLGLNYSFSFYATGGLETQVQTFFITAALLVGVCELGRSTPSRGGLALFSGLVALALLTRLDSFALLAVMAAVLLVASWRAKETGRGSRLLALALPVGSVIGVWIAWKLVFYGNALPNTFYAKLPGRSLSGLVHGVWYILSFLDEYWLVGPLLLALFAVSDLYRAPAARVVSSSLVLWCAYVIWVGGDFMEFRFIVPALPLVFWILSAFVACVDHKTALGVPLVAVILAGNGARVMHLYRNAHWDGVESIHDLEQHVDVTGDDWVDIGEALGQYFDHDPSVSISVTAAGAVPYYSRLTTVDMLGLNDPWIARHGDQVASARPGHQHMASFEYLRKRGVNLVIGHPTLTSPIKGDTYLIEPDRLEYLGLGRYAPAAVLALLSDVRAIEIPVLRGGEKQALYALYLTPSPRVNQAIRDKGLRILSTEVRGSN